jgi:MFS family permease
VIALYALTMAGLMLTGGKLGDIWGRRRAFSIGLVVYGAGSALTAVSWSVPALTLGWSILEGIGAALVLPALVALVAGSYEGGDRALAYGVLGGVAGAGIAVGPILGGWVTTDFTWRLVFVGEVVVALGILAGTRLIREPARERGAPPAQNLILMGVFFTIPLFLQVVQGLDALDTGVRMLPASAGMFLAAIAGSALAKRFAAKPLVRVGLLIVLAAILLLLGTIEPQLDNGDFLVAMGVLGIGMGLIVSQLGNVVQSAVGSADRSEAGGLQYTAQQLGSSLGTALLGAIVISGLIAAFTANVADDPSISGEVGSQLEVRLSAGGSFVASEEVRAGATAAGLGPNTVDALVSNYEDAQLTALKTAFLFAAFLVLASFWSTRRLPTQRFEQLQAGPDPPLAEPT